MPLDTDIFGKPSGGTQTGIRDTDIFGDAAPQSPSPSMQQAQVPERSFSQYAGDRLRQAPLNMLRGLMNGPQGLVQAGIGEANQTIGDAIDKSAYNAGGYVTDKAAKVLPPDAAAAAGYATNVATQVAPAVLTGQGAQRVLAPTMQSMAQRVMQMATKPTYEMHRTGQAARAIDTMLEEGINPTAGGVEKLRGMIDDLNTEIKTRIANSDATVYRGAVEKTLGDLLDRVKNQVNPNADMSAIRRAWSEFRNHPLLENPNIPVQLAQDMKKGTYQSLGSKPYGELQGASIEAQKQLARGLKEEIAKAVPEVGPLNARESALLNAKEVAERRSLMGGNNQILGLGMLNPFMLPLWLAERSPTLGGWMARGLHSGQQVLPNIGGSLLGGSIMAPQGVAPGTSPMLDLGSLYDYEPPSRGAPRSGMLSGGSR